MISKFITVWILTVTYDNHSNSVNQSYGAGYSYQLQYADQKTCLQQAKKHQTVVIPAKSWHQQEQVIRPHRQVRCDFAQQVVAVMK